MDCYFCFKSLERLSCNFSASFHSLDSNLHPLILLIKQLLKFLYFSAKLIAIAPIIRYGFLSFHFLNLLQQLIEALFRFSIYLNIGVSIFLGLIHALLDLTEPMHHGIEVLMYNFFLRGDLIANSCDIGR